MRAFALIPLNDQLNTSTDIIKLCEIMDMARMLGVKVPHRLLIIQYA